MSMTQTLKKLLSLVLVLIMLVGMVPTHAFAASADAVDTAVFFSDLHTKKSDYKESTLRNVMSRLKNSGMHISSVTSAGDAFSVNEDNSGSNGPYTGYTSTLTNAIQGVLGNVPVNYVWSDHDRYAVQEDGSTLLDKTSRLVYGAGNDGVYGTDDDGNYYVYALSMGDLGSYDRYKAGFNTDNGNSRSAKGFTATVEQAVANFRADAANLKKDRPLFIASHQPLFDNRNDNAFAEKWFDAINEVAAGMDVAFFYGHNHKYDTGSDYYYAKGSTMPVTTTNGWNGYQTGSGYQYTKGDPKPVNKTLNFTHMCAGYLAPSSTGSTSSTTREGTLVAVTIYDDSISYVTYNANGVYTGNYALNVTVPREFANVGGTDEPETTEPVLTEPEVTEPEETEPTPTGPIGPDLNGEWVALPAGNTYVLDTDGIDSGAKYLIVAESYAKALTAASSNNNAEDVVINGNNAAADSDCGWTFTASGNGYQIQKNGTYLGRSSGNLASGSSNTVWTVSNQGSGKYNVTQSGSSNSWWGGSSTYYVRWSNSNGYFQASTSNKNPVRLYKYTGSGSAINANYIRLAGEMEQNYVIADAADLNTVLGKIKIQTSADGNTVSGEIPVTANMVAWNTAFNGTAAGTYTGTVTCENKTLGTVTVTVIAQHNFETVTVDATCTQDGSITTRCTICGEQTVEIIKATGHDYGCVVTDPTCEAEGSKVFTCAACGDTYTETIPATGTHAYEAVTVEPTCVVSGSTTYTCGICGKSYVETIPATGKHIYRSETVNATCTEDGSVTYTCAYCSDSYVQTIPAVGHTYTCTVTEATCTKAGSKVYTCSVCGDTYTEELASLGHDYKAVVTAPTCTEGGFSTYTCTRCGDSYVGDAVAALGHRYETATVEATCTADGSVTHYCVCGDTYSEVIPSTGHDYKAVVTAPTCTTGGYTTHTCVSCGDSYVSDEVAALGHSNTTVVVAPTCVNGGYTADTCSACGEYRIYNETAALGHDYASVTVDPTETEGGYTTHTCNVCGHSYTDNYVDALGHTIVSVVTDPTCLTEGYTTHTCTVCGEVTVDTYVPALGHDHQTVTVDATCTADGCMTKTCARCGDTSTEVIGAYGHNYTATVTAPTCVSGGHTVYTCERCGDSYVADHTEATGHNYTSVTVDVTCTQDGYTTYLCTNCGDSYVGDTAPALGHSYETVTAEATCTEDGSVTHVCTRCGDSWSEVIPATGHHYESVITAPTCTEGGCTTYTCACGESYIADETPATGHSYSCLEENGNQIYTCDSCGDTYTVTIGWVNLSGTYVLDTDGIEIGADHKYIVVGSNKNYALTLSGSTIGAAAVTVENNAISLDDAAKYEFYFVNNNSRENGSYLLTQDGTKGVYHMGGNMYYGNDNKGYWHIGTNSNGAYQLYDYDNSTWYLNYGYVWANDSVSRFAVSSNARSVRLFKAADSYARLYGTLNQTWVHGGDVTESAVLSKVQIQTSTNGITADAAAPVDSSMVTWDKAFDGYTAGTYTAAVTYRGEKLGTITVTVTGEHAYRDTLKEATCTEAGYTEHTCTVCGYSYTDSNTAALGHSYTTKEENGKRIYTCSRCGHSYSESLAMTYTKVSSLSGNSNYVITFVSGSKYYAMSHKDNKISAVQVKVSNNQITTEITADLVWTYEGDKLSYKSGNTTCYLYAKPGTSWWGWTSTPTLTISSSNSTAVSFSSSKLKMDNYYLRYANGAISLNSRSSTTNLFLEQ